MNVDRVSGKVVLLTFFGGAALLAFLVAMAAKFYFLPAMINPTGRLDQPTTQSAPATLPATIPSHPPTTLPAALAK